MSELSIGLRILQDRGPMTLGDLTQEIAKEVGVATYYADTLVCMEMLLAAGKVTVDRSESSDILHVWTAVEKTAEQKSEPLGVLESGHMETTGKKYMVKIVMREFDQTSDDYHATITRLSDGVEFVSTSRWKWVLKRKLTLRKLDKMFKDYDKRQKKLEHKEDLFL